MLNYSVAELREYKYEPLERLKYLKIKTNPNSYPANTIIIPPMELE